QEDLCLYSKEEVKSTRQRSSVCLASPVKTGRRRIEASFAHVPSSGWALFFSVAAQENLWCFTHPEQLRRKKPARKTHSDHVRGGALPVN
ncbi:hypothetical protein AVEN_67942-1, partial [Araneus ventricosus]